MTPQWVLRRVLVALIASIALLGVGGASAAAAAPTTTRPAVRCPAPGETIDDAVSTAPPRHTPEELAAIRREIEAVVIPKRSSVSIGDGRDTVEVDLVPGSEALAARFVRRYGDAVRIHVGGSRYVPRGCGTPPAPARCPDLVGDAPKSAGVELAVLLDTPEIRASEAGTARLQVRNVGTSDFSIDSGIPLTGSLVRRGTRHVVGTDAFAVAGVGGGVHLAPGETGTIDMVFGAARCDGHAGSALPPGRYGLRVVLVPEGPAGADLSPRLLSPEVTVQVTP